MNVLLQKKVLVGLVAGCLVGCGSGGGGNSSIDRSGDPSGPSPVASAEPINASGEIDGFGSVIVNGKHYETDNAKFFINGEEGAEEQLEVGQVVQVIGQIEADGQAYASKVFMRSRLGGKVDVVDADARTLDMLGYQVHITDDTQLDEQISEVSLAELNGANIRVSGHSRAEGSVVATHIDLVEGGLDGSSMFGEIESVDTANGLLVLDGRVIDFSSAVTHGDAEDIAVGNRLIAHGALQDDVFSAEKVYAISSEKTEDNEVLVSASAKVKVEIGGMLELDGTDLTLNGMKITDIDSADILQGHKGDLVADVKIMVEGTQVGDTVTADKITIAKASQVSVVGSVESIDVEASTISIGNTTFSVAADTDFTDDSDNDVRMFSLADIAQGDMLKVKGYLNEDGVAVASQVNRLNPNLAGSEHFGRIMATIASMTDGMLLTTDGTEVALDDKTFVASQVDLDSLVLGDDGTELYILGIYTAESKLEAKVILLAESLEDGSFSEGQATVNENGVVTETVSNGKTETVTESTTETSTSGTSNGLNQPGEGGGRMVGGGASSGTGGVNTSVEL